MAERAIRAKTWWYMFFREEKVRCFVSPGDHSFSESEARKAILDGWNPGKVIERIWPFEANSDTIQAT